MKSYYINASPLVVPKLSENKSALDPNFEYISANQPKPNPGDTYGAGQYSEPKKFILIK